MTAQAYNALDGDSLGADKIIRATTMQSLYDNPTAIAQRGSGAPWNNGIGAVAVLTSGSGNWTVPDGVYRIKVTAVGGGGGGDGASTNGSAGGNTTFSTLTANGGAGGTSTGGAGGTATGGDLNYTGQNGGDFGNGLWYPGGGDSTQGSGGHPGQTGVGYGAGGGGWAQSGTAYLSGGGGGGGTAIKIFTTTPGATLAYAIGTGGAAGTDGGFPPPFPAASGTDGIIIIEY